jgi:hypothetical protein
MIMVIKNQKQKTSSSKKKPINDVLDNLKSSMENMLSGLRLFDPKCEDTDWDSDSEKLQLNNGRTKKEAQQFLRDSSISTKDTENESSSVLSDGYKSMDCTDQDGWDVKFVEDDGEFLLMKQDEKNNNYQKAARKRRGIYKSMRSVKKGFRKVKHWRRRSTATDMIILDDIPSFEMEFDVEFDVQDALAYMNIETNPTTKSESLHRVRESFRQVKSGVTKGLQKACRTSSSGGFFHIATASHSGPTEKAAVGDYAAVS